MFDRLQRPFLTVETGEAYQPVRLSYEILNKEVLAASLEKLTCIQKAANPNTWHWYWQGECEDQHFESVNSFQKNSSHPVRLGTFIIHHKKLFLTLSSFKRACLAVPFFHRFLDLSVARIQFADFINKVFALDERLPHGFTEIFKDEELEQIIQQRLEDYEQVKQKCEEAPSAENALTILADYTRSETAKRLPYAERYAFELDKHQQQDPEVIFLAFYIFLRGRELVAIKRWFGQAGYSLADAADSVIDGVFGDLGIDVID